MWKRRYPNWDRQLHVILINIRLPYKDQKSASEVSKQLSNLSMMLRKSWRPVFVSRKIMVELRICEKKPLLLSQQCVTATYINASKSIKWVLWENKHVKEIHGQSEDNVNDQFSVLRKWMNKFDCLVDEMLLIKQYKPNLNRLNGQSDSIRSNLFWVLVPNTY